MAIGNNKGYKFLKRFFGNLQDTVEFLNSYNQLIDDSNYNFQNLSFNGNFNCEIINNLVLPAGQETQIPHKLGIIPAYRLILRQTGNSLITDGTFSANNIKLINTGTSDAVITLALFKE